MIQPLLAEADSAITSLESANDLAGIQKALDAENTEITSLAKTVDTKLSCDDCDIRRDLALTSWRSRRWPLTMPTRHSDQFSAFAAHAMAVAARSTE